MSQAPGCRVAGPRLPCRSPRARLCRGSSACAVSWLGSALYCDTMPCPASCPWSQHTRCIAIQHLQQPSSSIAIHLLPTKLNCNTTEPLQYNFFPRLQYNPATSLPAIQFCVLQYNSLAYQPSPAIQFSKLYCNTISLVTML